MTFFSLSNKCPGCHWHDYSVSNSSPIISDNHTFHHRLGTRTWERIYKVPEPIVTNFVVSMKSFYVIKLDCQCWKINSFGGEGGGASEFKITSKINDNNSKAVNSTSPVDYLFQIYKNPFRDMKTDRTSTKEIEKITNHQNIKTRIVMTKSLSNSFLSSPFISSQLKCICNKSLSSHIFPVHLKYSEIQPLFKKMIKII